MSECSAIVLTRDLEPLPPVSVAPLEALPPPPPLEPLGPFDATPVMPEAPVAQPAEEATLFPLAQLDAVPYATSPAQTVVAQVLAQTGEMAASSQAQAIANIEALANYRPSYSPLVALDVPAPAPVVLAGIGEAPEAGDLTAHFATAPTMPGLPALTMPEFDNPPAYDVPGLTLFDIALPDPMDALLPDEPEFEAVGVVNMPDLPLPPVPTFADLALPEPPTIELPTFDAVMGDAPSAPEATFAYAEVEYNTALLSAMQARLAPLVGDMASTGLNELVEQAIWNRAADREALLTHRAIGEALRLMKARGFRMPEAALVRIVQQALQGSLQRDAGLRREIIIDQARRQQANYRFAVETAVTLEGRMLERANAAQARSLEAAKAGVQAEMAMFNARVALYSAEVQAFAMKAAGFRARLEGALGALAVYRAEIEALGVIGQINAQKVALYRAQVGGLNLIVDVYKAKVEGAKAQMAGNLAYVDAYRARIDAFKATVEAKDADYDGYAAQIKGQAAKVELYEQQVRGYQSRVGAFGALVKANISAQTLRFRQTSEFPLALYQAQVDAYRSGAGASIEQLRTSASVFGARVKAFSAQEAAKAGHLDAQVRIAAANAEASIAQAQTMIAAGNANLQVVEGAVQSVQSNLRSAGQLAGQLAAAAIAAQSVHASISESGSQSVSNSASASSSNSKSTATSTSTGSSSSTNVSHSASTGTSVSNTLSQTEGRSYSKGVSSGYSNRRSTSNSTGISAHNSTSRSASTGDSVSESVNCTDSTVVSE